MVIWPETTPAEGIPSPFFSNFLQQDFGIFLLFPPYSLYTCEGEEQRATGKSGRDTYAFSVRAGRRQPLASTAGDDAGGAQGEAGEGTVGSANRPGGPGSGARLPP